MPRLSRLAALLALLAAPAVIAQTTRTVDNNLGAPTGPLVYTTFDAAHAVAVDGDTIQFVPSPTRYGNSTLFIRKRLTVRGGNLRTRAEQGGQTVGLQDIAFQTSDDPQNPQDPSGSSFEGLIVYGQIYTNNPINNLKFSNCILMSNIGANGANFNSMNNLQVVNSIVFSISGGNSIRNSIFRNNIIFGGIALNPSSFNTIDHNIFAQSAGIQGQNMIISNNIFLVPVTSNGITGSVFSNNLSFATSGTALPLPHPTNSGTGNLVNVNPLLVNFPTATTLATVLTTDFRLQPGSPAINAGSDGTDIGPTGGAAPFTSFFTGSPPQPVVTRLDVSPVVFVGAPVRVQVTAVGAIGAPAPRPAGAPDEPLPSEPAPATLPASRDADNR